MKWHLLFPLLSSLLYVGGILLMKRAGDLRVGVLRTTFVSNLVAAVVFLALLPMGGEPIVMGKLWQPLMVAFLFIGGQAFTFLALQKGDVSVATPTMGVKTICVAWLSVLILSVEIPWQLWLSAVMTFVAIGLLNATGRKKSSVTPNGSEEPSQTGRTILLSLLAAICFATFDVLVQKWAPAWGAGRFLPVMLGMSAGLSCGFLPFFKEPLHKIPRAAWPWLAGGSVIIGLQALFLVTALAVYGDATAMNVVYSARGLWSVAAVWLIGHWFHNQEQHLGAGILRLRMLGAAVMTIAIVVTLMM